MVCDTENLLTSILPTTSLYQQTQVAHFIFSGYAPLCVTVLTFTRHSDNNNELYAVRKTSVDWTLKSLNIRTLNFNLLHSMHSLIYRCTELYTSWSALYHKNPFSAPKKQLYLLVTKYIYIQFTHALFSFRGFILNTIKVENLK